MDFIQQALLKSGILTAGGYVDDACIRSGACVYDSHGRLTHRIHYACNGVDLVAENVKTGLVELRLCL